MTDRELIVAYFIMGRRIYFVHCNTERAFIPNIGPVASHDWRVRHELKKWYTYAEIDDAEQRNSLHQGAYNFTQQDFEYARLWVDAGWYETCTFGAFLEGMRGKQEEKFYHEDYWTT